MTKTKENHTDSWVDFTLPFGGREVFVSISPCSWMYDTYGLQVSLATKANACNAESEFVRDKSIQAATMSRDDLRAAAETTAVQWLEANGLSKLDEAVSVWAVKAGTFAKTIAAAAKKEAKARLKRLTKLQAKGFTHVMDAWIHPESGDDYRAEVCFSEPPTKEDIKRALRASTVKTDYKVSGIAEAITQLTQESGGVS